MSELTMMTAMGLFPIFAGLFWFLIEVNSRTQSKEEIVDKEDFFSNMLAKNDIHTMDDIIDRLLSIPPNEWELSGNFQMTCDLFIHENEEIYVAFDEEEDWFDINYQDECFIDVRNDSDKQSAFIEATLFDDEGLSDDVKWKVLFRHLSNVYQTKVNEETEQKEIKQEKHLLDMKKKLAKLLNTRVILNTKEEHAFRLAVSAFKTTNIATATFYFENQPFVIAELNDNRYTSKWIQKGRDFEAVFGPLSPEIDEYLERTLQCELMKQAGEKKEIITTEQTPPPEDAISVMLAKIEAILCDAKWLLDDECFLLEETYPNDLKRLREAMKEAGYQSFDSAHVEEVCETIENHLNELVLRIKNRKEQQVVEAKKVLLVREI